MVPPKISDARRRNMAAIKNKNTKPELVVRRLLHSAGLRYRLHDKQLPGKPDIVLTGLRTVVQVHGCFWHHHGCANSVWPKTRAAFWRAKIMSNVRRDRANDLAVARLGWRVVTVWECETKDLKRLVRVVRPMIQRHRRTKRKNVGALR
jgi:DNA mismatch endonuclease, patch repair protein